VGEHDVSDMHEIAQQLEAAIPGAAHIPNMEQPARFDQLMPGFLAADYGRQASGPTRSR
jgi:hypothetical protein